MAKEKKAVFQSVKGMRDILPEDQPTWEKIKNSAHHVAEFYNFLKIDTPLVEPAELFERGVGKNTDIVEKEMFFVKSRSGDDRWVLRPEGTAPVMRAYYENGLSRYGQPIKLYYEGPTFRYEQPQAGRYRQLHQIGFEILGGESDPVYDVYAILAPYRVLEEMKIKNIMVHINSIGCPKCRANYVKKLDQYYKKNLSKVCKDCKHRVDVNPLRVLDCKEEKCQEIKNEAPIILDYLCEGCKTHFKKVLEYLDEVKIPYSVNPFIVRGLDYYNRTVFEFFAEGFNYALGGGGRFDYLAEILKVGKLSAVGSSLGMDRIFLVLKETDRLIPMKSQAKVFIIHMGDEAKKRGLSLIEEFRRANIKVSESFGRESLKAQLRIADKEKVQYALILGQREVFEENIIIRDMDSGAQETVPLAKVVEDIKKRVR